jgi:hypothetical protein
MVLSIFFLILLSFFRDCLGFSINRLTRRKSFSAFSEIVWVFHKQINKKENYKSFKFSFYIHLILCSSFALYIDYMYGIDFIWVLKYMLMCLILYCFYKET